MLTLMYQLTLVSRRSVSLLSEYSFTQFVDEPTYKHGYILDWLVTVRDSTHQ